MTVRALALDGAHGEGGGQLVRTACTLSALTGTAVHLHSVRARRQSPDLAPQNLATVAWVIEEFLSVRLRRWPTRSHVQLEIGSDGIR